MTGPGDRGRPGGGWPDEDVLAEALERINRPDYQRWAARIEATGGCAHPVRLVGSQSAVDRATGEAVTTFHTGGEPDRVLLKACGARRATRCPACASVYQTDARVLVIAGLNGGKGVPDTVRDHPAVFATLTAPSFGSVHAATDADRACHPAPPGRCAHGRPRACAKHHDTGDPVVGSPLCSDCYDYPGAVIWNNRASELWRRTIIDLRRVLAAETGVTVKTFDRRELVSFVKVVEYQRRGLVHLHAVIRLDRSDGTTPQLTAGELAAAVHLTAGRVQAPNPYRPDRPIRWGRQIDVDPVTDTDRRSVASYLAKYTTKSTDTSGVLDHRLRTGDLRHPKLPEHLARMVRTAWTLGGQPELADLNLRPWAHTLGYRGHWLTKSRHWSTTLGALRQARHNWQLQHHRGNNPRDPRGRPLNTDQVVEIGDWTYTGTGHTNNGDAWLAANTAIIRKQNRRTAWEEAQAVDARQTGSLSADEAELKRTGRLTAKKTRLKEELR